MTDAAPHRTPLTAEHEALGATLTPFGGWLMPLRYAGELAEHRAVRTAAGIFDLSHMGEISVTGPDAAAFLDHALVGAISGIRLMGARYSMIVAEDGGVLDDLIVYHNAQGEYLVVANAANRDTVVSALTERASGFDVSVVDGTDRTALIGVQGPRALEVLEAVPGLSATAELSLGGTLRELRYYACTGMGFAGTAVLVARTGYTGEDGFELFVDAGAAARLWRAVLEAGEPFGLVPAGLSARDSLRLEAGMPLYGHELTRDVTPFDAGLGRVVRFDKVDADGEPLEFVGRAALARVAAELEKAELDEETPSRRILVGLAGEGRRPLRADYEVLAPDGDTTAVVGRVTSGGLSPTLGHPIALAFVEASSGAPGTPLHVDVRGRREPVRVVDLPFYTRPRPPSAARP